MSTGTDLLAEGTPIPAGRGEGTPIPVADGGQVNLLFDMYALVQLEEKFGGLQAIQEMFPKDGTVSNGMFTKLAQLLHLGLLHLDWSFEDACHAMQPKHLQVYMDALGKELNFGGDDEGPKGIPVSPGTTGITSAPSS